ncbi:MAG: TonB-dependent receptor [Desulfobulbaceae bacterium]|nr:TonB-dependent receptor [Desulfobulbaceae bacterium]HIJ90744.1 TonB-dependent receptor [Deltaproteobacteria bacterium]
MGKKRVMAVAALLSLSGPNFAMAADAPLMSSNKDEAKAFAEMFGKGPQEEDVYRTDRLLLTATGSLKPVHLAPSVASVITADDIRGMGATTLDEVLEAVPGLHVEPSGNAYFSSIWSIRGVHTSTNPQVLLLINGVPLTVNYLGSRNICFQMPVAMISRVEVVRGPGSALHGADAFSGTVNVITKDNFEINGTQAGARYGSFDTSDIWAQHGGQYGGFDVAFGVERRKTGGDMDRIIERDSLHAIGQAALSNTPGHMDTWNEQLDSHLNVRKENWTLHLYGTLQESSLGPGGVQAITYGNDLDTKSLLADLTYHNDKLVENWTLESRIYYSYIYGDNFIQFFPSSYLNMLGNPLYTSQDGGLEASGVYKGFRNHQLRMGAGAKSYNFGRDQYKNFGPAAGANQFGPMVHVTNPAHIYIDEASRTLFYGLVQDEWQLAKAWTLTVGARYDEYSDFGSTVNPRAALVWETRYDLTTKLMYGQAFRAPSFGEQYVKNNPQIIGNPNLLPEEIETIELAFDYQPTKDLRLILSLFNYEATELVELVGPMPQIYTNYGKQEGNGFELEMDWRMLRDFRLRSNFAYQRSENKMLDNAVVPDAPQMQFYLNPSWAFMPDWSLDGHFYWIGDRPRAKGDPRGDIADYEVVNLLVRRKNIAGHLEAAVGIMNLFDEVGRIPSPYAVVPGGAGASIPDDYPMAGRAVWGEISYRF